MSEKTPLHMAKLTYKQPVTTAVQSYPPVNRKLHSPLRTAKAHQKCLKVLKNIHSTVGLIVSDNLYIRKLKLKKEN